MTYPYTAWTLQPSFKPVEVQIVRNYHGTWEQTDSGKTIMAAALFPTKEAAIADGWKRVEEMQAALDKRTENLRKKRAALNKAAGKSA